MEMKPGKDEFKKWQKEHIDIIPEEERKKLDAEAREYLMKKYGSSFFDKKKKIAAI